MRQGATAIGSCERVHRDRPERRMGEDGHLAMTDRGSRLLVVDYVHRVVAIGSPIRAAAGVGHIVMKCISARLFARTGPHGMVA